jgi:hypothetical protein
MPRRSVVLAGVVFGLMQCLAIAAILPPESVPASSPWHPVALLAFVTTLAFFFAMLEIQIEGPHGWAAALPTWRIEKHPLLDLFWGGRPMTGYHAWAFSFMAAVFHLPLILSAAFTLRMEARIIGCLAIFWIVEDFLWFVMNPAFGIRRFRPVHVWWHRRWLLRMPLDYVTFLAVGGALFAYSFRGGS